jgi:hypothetical protein
VARANSGVRKKVLNGTRKEDIQAKITMFKCATRGEEGTKLKRLTGAPVNLKIERRRIEFDTH